MLVLVLDPERLPGVLLDKGPALLVPVGTGDVFKTVGRAGEAGAVRTVRGCTGALILEVEEVEGVSRGERLPEETEGLVLGVAGALTLSTTNLVPLGVPTPLPLGVPTPLLRGVPTPLVRGVPPPLVRVVPTPDPLPGAPEVESTLEAILSSLLWRISSCF